MKAFIEVRGTEKYIDRLIDDIMDFPIKIINITKEGDVE